MASFPMVREHGAWVMAATPVAMALAVPGPMQTPSAAALCALAIAALFLAQEGWRMWLAGHRRERLNRWVVALAGVGATLGVLLLLVWQRTALLYLAGAGALVLTLQSALIVAPGRTERSVAARLAAVPGITLGGPAVLVAGRGQFDQAAVVIWLASTAFFAGGVAMVAMLVAAARRRRRLQWADRWRLGRLHLLSHALLTTITCWWALGLPEAAAMVVIAGLLPLLIRAGLVWSRMSNQLPAMVRVGIIETAVTSWAGGAVVWALHLCS